VGYGGLSQYATARAFKWTMWLTPVIEFVVRGEEHLRTRPAVFIGNHQTYVSSKKSLNGRALWSTRKEKHGPPNKKEADKSVSYNRELDVLMLGAVFPPYCSVTSKKSLRYVPILGWFSTSLSSRNALLYTPTTRHDAYIN